MSIEVRVPPLLQRRMGGTKSVHANGETVAALLDDLNRRFPGVKGQLFTADGELHRFVNVYLNDEDIRFLDSLNTELADGDVVLIMPAMSGGY